jgi:hypothetical protein
MPSVQPKQESHAGTGYSIVFDLKQSMPIQLKPSKPIPDFDRDVLVPLHAAQKKAADDAAAAAKAKADADAAAAAAQAAAQQAIQVTPVQSVPTVAVGGSCAEWMAAAGVSDPGIASILISHESGCNPNAVNPSSGACGIGQALPCSKMGCAMGDGYCQMRWTNQYVLGRYGSWNAAWSFWQAHSWY